MVGSAPFADLPKRRGVTAAGGDKGSSSDSDCVANIFTELHLRISELLRVPQPNIPRLVQQSMKEIIGIQNLVFSYTGPESTGMFVPLGREVQGSRAAFDTETGAFPCRAGGRIVVIKKKVAWPSGRCLSCSGLQTPGSWVRNSQWGWLCTTDSEGQLWLVSSGAASKKRSCKINKRESLWQKLRNTFDSTQILSNCLISGLLLMAYRQEKIRREGDWR